MDVNEVQIDESIRPYLNEIAERLWSTPTHAAIMVGAGFSKNANRDFPDWSTLGDIFFEKIHGKIPDKNSGEHRYLNALKLADEVQAAFGRPALDQLLRSNIPDTDSQIFWQKKRNYLNKWIKLSFLKNWKFEKLLPDLHINYFCSIVKMN